jgi:predicted HTH domain antitoxin
MKTKTITTRVPEDLFREIKEIGEVEKIDRTEVVKRLLSDAAKHWKTERAVNLLRDGKVTLRRAARIAEVTYVEMLDLSSQMDIVIKMEPEDVIRDLEG